MVTTTKIPTRLAKWRPIALIFGLMAAMLRWGQRQLNPKSTLRAVLEYPIGVTLLRPIEPLLDVIGKLFMVALILTLILVLVDPSRAMLLWIAMGG